MIQQTSPPAGKWTTRDVLASSPRHRRRAGLSIYPSAVSSSRVIGYVILSPRGAHCSSASHRQVRTESPAHRIDSHIARPARAISAPSDRITARCVHTFACTYICMYTSRCAERKIAGGACNEFVFFFFSATASSQDCCLVIGMYFFWIGGVDCDRCCWRNPDKSKDDYWHVVSNSTVDYGVMPRCIIISFMLCWTSFVRPMKCLHVFVLSYISVVCSWVVTEFSLVVI